MKKFEDLLLDEKQNIARLYHIAKTEDSIHIARYKFTQLDVAELRWLFRKRTFSIQSAIYEHLKNTQFLKHILISKVDFEVVHKQGRKVRSDAKRKSI